MSLSVLSVVGLAALGGGVATGLTVLVVVAVAWLVAVALLNAITVLGELLDGIHDPQGSAYDTRNGRSRPPSAD